VEGAPASMYRHEDESPLPPPPVPPPVPTSVVLVSHGSGVHVSGVVKFFPTTKTPDIAITGGG
jgi:hypothetical protein